MTRISGKFLTMAAGVVLLGGVALSGCTAGSSTTGTTSQPSPATSTPPSVTSAVSPASSATSAETSAGSATSGSNDQTSQPTGGTSGSGGASSATTSSAPPVRDASLTLGLVLEPVSLDFTTQSGAAIPQVLLDNIYETLVKQDQSTGKLVPALAKSWTVSADQKTYTFELQSGVTFSDGSPFTADDAVFSINYVKTKWTVPVSAQMKIVDSATAVSPTELKVVLSRPSNMWLYSMTTRIGAMMSPNGVSDLANKALGTGPYTFTRWNRGDSITLTRNDSYWGTKPNVKTVILKYFQDPTAMNNALLTGGINVITTVQTPQALAQFQNNAKYQVINGTTNGKVMMTINNARKPLDDVRVRQAINYALDKAAILKTAWAGYGTVIGSHEVPTDPWYVDLANKYPHDVAKAKDLLAQAGQSNLTLRLAVPPVPYAQAAAPIIVSELAQAGITVKASNVTFDNWLAKIFAKPYDYDLTIINHVEPRDVTTVFSGMPDYYTQYTNPKVAELEKAGDAGSAQDLVTDFSQVMNILANDAAAAWLWAFPNLMVADANVHGLPQNAVGEALDVSQLSVG